MKIEREGLGNNLHTALRKCCDSKITSLLWNFLYLENSKSLWQRYLDFVYLEINNPIYKDNAKTALKEAFKKLEESNIAQTHEFFIFRILLYMFEESDWDGFAYFLQELLSE